MIMRNKKWNISILVIFILLASSLIWILTSNYVRELFSYSDNISKYYKSYYISKWWLELALAQINNRGVWFQYSLATWNEFSKSNFLCNWMCSFSSDVYGVSSKISKQFDEWTGCDYPFLLSGGDSVVLPLFRDSFEGSIVDSLNKSVEYKNLAFNLSKSKIVTKDLSKEINIWIIFLSGGDISDQWFFFKKLLLNEDSIKEFWAQFETYAKTIFVGNKSLMSYYEKNEILKDDYMKSYLILSNPQKQSNLKFCISVKEEIENLWNGFLSLPYYYVRVIWNTSDFLLWLDSQINQPIPGFLANVYSDY